VKGGGAIEEVTYLSRLSSSQKQSVCVQYIDLVRERTGGALSSDSTTVISTSLHMCTVKAVGITIHSDTPPSTGCLVETQHWDTV